MIRLLFGVSVFVLLAAVNRSTVAVASPVKIIIQGAGLREPVEIAEGRDPTDLWYGLCYDQLPAVPERDLVGRPSLDISIQWTPDPNGETWRGKLYPALDDKPLTADIRERTLNGELDKRVLCEPRVANVFARDVLNKYGVPTRVDVRAALPQTGTALTDGNWIPLMGITGLLLLALAGVVNHRFQP